jgi:hypothetical protein
MTKWYNNGEYFQFVDYDGEYINNVDESLKYFDPTYYKARSMISAFRINFFEEVEKNIKPVIFPITLLRCFSKWCDESNTNLDIFDIKRCYLLIKNNFSENEFRSIVAEIYYDNNNLYNEYINDAVKRIKENKVNVHIDGHHKTIVFEYYG